MSPEFFPLQLFSSKAGVESARRQCDKLVSLRDLLENIQNGDTCVGEDIRSLSTSISSMALDYCGPIRLDKELGVKTTQKVGKDTLLLVLRSVGGLVSEAESLTLEERTAQRMQHSNTLCGRLSYLCSVDIATKEVVESLSRFGGCYTKFPSISIAFFPQTSTCTTLGTAQWSIQQQHFCT